MTITDNLNVMLVDDEYLMRELLKNLINWQELGLEITNEAASGVEAWHKFNDSPVDIIIADINMPYMDGLQLSRHVKDMYPATRIIILTGHDEFHYAQTIIKIGVTDFILKPINHDELREALVKTKKEIQNQIDQKNELMKLKSQQTIDLVYMNNQATNVIARIKVWINENLSNLNMTLTYAAEIFHHNPSYLSRKFKEATGVTFMEYLAKARLKKAIKLITETDLLNYEIAYQVGIPDPHYFSIFFKKQMQMTISEFKKRNKNPRC